MDSLEMIRPEWKLSTFAVCAAKRSIAIQREEAKLNEMFSSLNICKNKQRKMILNDVR